MENGAWSYCESDDVLYVGNGCLAIHARTEGIKEIDPDVFFVVTDSYQVKGAK